MLAAQLAMVALGASGCRAAAHPKPALAAPVEQGRAQAKLDDRLRRLENRLELTQAQLLVMREQLRQVENGTARAPREPARAKLLRLHGNGAGAEGANNTPWPVEQRILTDKHGRTRLVSAAEADALAGTPPSVAPARPRSAPGWSRGTR